MFANGSLLRRRKRFKLHKHDKDILNEEFAALANMNRFFTTPNEFYHSQMAPQSSIVDIPFDANSHLGISSPFSCDDEPRTVSPKSISPVPIVQNNTILTTNSDTTVRKPKRKFNIESLIEIEPDDHVNKKPKLESFEGNVTVFRQQNLENTLKCTLLKETEPHHHQQQLIRQFTNYELPSIHPLIMMSPLAMKLASNSITPYPYFHHYQNLRLDTLANQMAINASHMAIV